MVCHRSLALAFLAMFMAAFVVPSCTDCADGGVGCPCQVPLQCNNPGPCSVALCDGTCWLMERPVGAVCNLNTCTEADHCEGVCTKAGACVPCLHDWDCEPGHSCEAGNVCTSCHDGVKNGDEVDVDCGGSCSLCPGTCYVDADCPGGYCWENVCVSCHDGIQNGDEVGVDCSWGGHCGYCLGFDCAGQSDAVCASQVCDNARCCEKVCPECYYCGTWGICEPIPNGLPASYPLEPERNCDGNFRCDGQGKCLLDSGQPCTQDSECVENICMNGKCG